MASLKFMVRKTPLLISTTIKHYVKGPPQPSWDLKIHITNEFLKSTLLDCVNQTVEEIQELSSLPNPAPADITINESKVDNKYRYEAQTYLENILKPYEHVLDTEWKDLKEDGIVAEWVQVSNDGWEERKSKKTVLYLHGGAYYLCSKDSHRYMTTVLARRANARVFVINYRLAPQNQFPAGLQDALAAYLYLLNPPENAGFKSLNPKDIVIAGDSAGGGLSMALSLAIRDAGLPQCAGIICMSPWIDLTSSMPSMLNDKCNDYIPNLTLGLQHIDSPAITDYKKKAAALTAKIKKQNIEPKIWHDSFGNHKERLNMYAPNEGLAIPYVSPLLAESLCNLPPLLLIAGDEERLRDEVIYLAYRATEPTKYKGPSYLGKFEESPFQTPTNITLEIYEEMPHVFQMFESQASAILSMERMIGFIIRVIETPTNELPPSSFYRISSEGKLTPLDGHYKEVLEWEKVGISPSIRANVEDSRKLKMEFVTFMVLFATVISYFML